MLWRKELGVVQKLFRWLNETAYLISVPFLMLILLGAIVGSRPLALLGATAVVLLNIGRIVAGVANLAVVPFREGIFQGIMFLIPPLTFFYLSSHWNKLKKPTMRIVGPIVTIALVFLAFTLIPSLRKDGKAASPEGPQGRDPQGASSRLEGEMIGEVKKAKIARRRGPREAGREDDSATPPGKINSIGQPGGDRQDAADASNATAPHTSGPPGPLERATLMAPSQDHSSAGADRPRRRGARPRAHGRRSPDPCRRRPGPTSSPGPVGDRPRRVRRGDAWRACPARPTT